MPNWETDAEGFIIFKPIIGWETALLAETTCGLRVEFVHTPADIGTPGEGIQLTMTPKQALQLADDLREMARKATHVPPGTVRS